LKPEWWESPLVQEKYQEERPVTRDDNTNNSNNDSIGSYLGGVGGCSP